MLCHIIVYHIILYYIISYHTILHHTARLRGLSALRAGTRGGSSVRNAVSWDGCHTSEGPVSEQVKDELLKDQVS